MAQNDNKVPKRYKVVVVDEKGKEIEVLKEVSMHPHEAKALNESQASNGMKTQVKYVELKEK